MYLQDVYYFFFHFFLDIFNHHNKHKLCKFTVLIVKLLIKGIFEGYLLSCKNAMNFIYTAAFQYKLV